MLTDERSAGPLLKRTKHGGGSSLVKVVVRLRPGQPGEGRNVVSVDENNTVTVEDPVEKTPGMAQGWCRSGGFTVDHAFDAVAPTSDIYKDTVQRLVSCVVREGTNACCFAFGATGSGKTYTMEGTGESPGVMQLAIRDLFSWAEPSATVVASYFQIYCENVTDLLHTDEQPVAALQAPELAVRMDADGRTQVVGLREVVVASENELLALLTQGSARRATFGTAVNETSSRSHAVLQVVLHQPGRGLTSKLSMIDLAGSERTTRANTHAGGERFLEARNINHSLLALSKAIRCRVAGTKPNYRESKLTRLLEDSLTGGATTTMVCTCSPAAAVFDETLQTLQRAQEVKQIKRPATAPPIRTYIAPPPAVAVPVETPRIAALLDLADAVALAPAPPDAPSLRPRRVHPRRNTFVRVPRTSRDSVDTASFAPAPSSAEIEAMPSTKYNSWSGPAPAPTSAAASAACTRAASPRAALERRRDLDLEALVARVKGCDDAQFSIFLRASNALLDGLDESFTRLHTKKPVAPAPKAPSPPVGLKASPPVTRRDLPPLSTDSLPGERDSPPVGRDLLPRSPPVRLLSPRSTSPLVESSSIILPLPVSTRGLLHSRQQVGGIGVEAKGLPPVAGAEPSTPVASRVPSQQPSRIPTPPSSRTASRPGSRPTSRPPSHPGSLASSRTPSRTTSPQTRHRRTRSDGSDAKTTVACGSGRSAATACVTAWVTSADGATTYQEVGYRSPAGAEGDVLEVLS